MNARLKKYWPEVVACVLLVAYTIVRTIVVAYGISPVSEVSWQIFLAIEIITTVPYVWAVGVIVRRSSKRREGQVVSRLWVPATVAVVSLLAPYVYLAMYGTLTSAQGIGIFLGLLVIFTLPSLTRLVVKIRRRLQA